MSSSSSSSSSSSLVVDGVCETVEPVEFVPNKLYFYPYPKKSSVDCLCYYVDDDVHYDSFYSDFGPFNLSVLYRFCQKLSQYLKNLTTQKRIYVCCSCSDEVRVNTAYLMGAYAIIYLGMSAEIAYLRLHKAEPHGYIGFRDAAMGPPTYVLHLHNVLRSIEKALKFNWLCFGTFDPNEYEYHEKVENGDLNWIIPNKVLSFCGPHKQSIIENGYPYHAPEVYFDYFRSHNVTTVIRLNKRMYDAKRFIDAGFEHVDLFFVDGSTPSDEIVERFISVVDAAKGGVAVHCKAGLGRTGTLIACWLMKEYGITAAESMAWLRICRPGSVIGPQQQFLIEKQPWCWALGSLSASSHLSQLTTKVNEIRIQDGRLVALERPNSLKVIKRSVKKVLFRSQTANGEAEDEKSQGDQLLAQKAKAQHAMPHAKYTSPTTPIKPLSHSIPKNITPRLPKRTGKISPPPISRVIVTSSKPTKSKSSKRLTGLRNKPYPSIGVKLNIPQSVYELRSQTATEINVVQLNDAAKNLPPNSAALVGARRNLNHIFK